MRSLILALQFLTKLPFPSQDPITERDITLSLVYFPVIGAAMGAIVHLTHLLLEPFFSGLLLGSVIVLFEFLLSGGLHFDGLSDLADAWLGAYDREKRLQIMKDSRIGVMGAAILLLDILIKAILIASWGGELGLMVLYGLGAKLVMVLGVYVFPYARPLGTGNLYSQVGTKEVALSILLAVPAIIITDYRVLAIGGLSLGVALIIALAISKQLKGLTGDCYGALHEIFQIVLLLGWEMMV